MAKGIEVDSGGERQGCCLCLVQGGAVVGAVVGAVEGWSLCFYYISLIC
jgi:hypothetical protein